MVFSSLVFIGLFLPISLVLYFLNRSRVWRNGILLICSLIFYAWGEPVWIVAMLALTFADFILAKIIDNVRKCRKGLLALTVIINLAMLFVVKYYDFFINAFNSILGTKIPLAHISMPIGISFFTFQALTYVVDVYRNEAKPQKNYFYLLLYISMFPQLIAGPIVRYSDIEKQIEDRKETLQGFINGMFRFSIGLGKKVIFANIAGNVATSLLSDNLSGLSAAASWFGLLMYSMQIYFDFSGYSDMAIGLGHVFGFDYKENFKYPYIANSISDFWRRWHISLGSFFRDYVYIPMGGNRKHQYLNIIVVWMLTGLWHGASWNFVMWGMFYGILLIIEKVLRHVDINIEKVPVAGNALVLILVVYSMSLFYFTNFSELVEINHYIFGIGNRISMNMVEITVIYQYIWMVPFMIIGCTPLPSMLAGKLFKKNTQIGNVMRSLVFCALYGLCFMLILNQTYNPFLYFRF